MRIIRQLIPVEEMGVWARNDMVAVRGYQMVIPVSLTGTGRSLEAGTPQFPAILDTGNTHNFAIRHSQLERWSGLVLGRRVQSVRIGGGLVGVYAARLWIHGISGPYLLDVKPGIIAYPDDDNPARLPIIGLRALVRNRLKLVVDGDGKLVTLKTRGWF